MTNLLLLAVLIAAVWTAIQSGKLFHVAMYSGSIAAGPNLDVTAASDGVFGTRNNHLILTDNYNIIAAHAMGALLTRDRFENAQLIQYGIPHLWPLSVSATIEDLPPVIDMRDRPFVLPTNEEIVITGSMSGAGPTRNEITLWIAAPSWTRQIAPYHWSGVLRGTVVIAAGAEGAWGLPVTGIFERDPIGGVYEVFGAELVAANAVAFRLRFPDMVNITGKQFRPGGLVQDNASLEPWRVQRGELGGLGPWGRFHTFVQPQWEVFGDSAGGTYEFRLHVGYVGSDRNLVNQIPAQ